MNRAAACMLPWCTHSVSALLLFLLSVSVVLVSRFFFCLFCFDLFYCVNMRNSLVSLGAKRTAVLKESLGKFIAIVTL